MTQLYIFDCDDFILSQQGGIFIQGRRQVELTGPSAGLLTLIATLVGAKTAFLLDRLPGDLVLPLQRAGLLREQGSTPRRMSAFRAGSRVFLVSLVRNIAAILPVPLVAAILAGANAVARVSALASKRLAFTLLSATATGHLVHPWARLTAWPCIGLIGLCNGAWLALYGYEHITHPIPLGSLSIGERFGSAAIVMLLLVFHELSHAAAAHYRLGRCGAVTLDFRHLLPGLSTAAPQTATLGRLDKIIISASGCVLQISMSIIGISMLGQYKVAEAAAEWSLAIGLANLLPIYRFDGYWIASELVGETLKCTLPGRQATTANLLYTLWVVSFAGLVIGGAIIQITAR